MNKTVDDSRLTRGALKELDKIVERGDRATNDAASRGERELSDDERVELFNLQFAQAALPDLPPIPGWHVCWLTASNPRDSLANRARVGYVPVTSEDVRGWDQGTVKSADQPGFISINEMVAYKIPEALYQRLMREYHHDAPYREEQKITQIADSARAAAQSVGGDVVEGDGIAELRRAQPRVQTFS